MSEAQLELSRSTFYSGKGMTWDSPRTRICAAVVELLSAHGHENTTVTSILDRAEVSELEFRGEFTGPEEAAIAAYEEMAPHYVWRVQQVFDGTRGSWRERLRAAAHAAARTCRDNPVDLRFAICEMKRISRRTRHHRDSALEPLVEMVNLGREETESRSSCGRSAAEAAIGAAVGAIESWIESGGQVDPCRCVPQLMYMAVRPYLGSAAAVEELTIPPPPAARSLIRDAPSR